MGRTRFYACQLSITILLTDNHHTLFLFAIARSKQYSMKQGEVDKDITDFLRDIFSSSYTEFLLNFGTEQLMASLEA